MPEKIVAVIQARMTSSRLPGKVLMRAKGEPMLTHLLSRLKRSSLLNDTIVATTTLETDEPIVHLCKELGVSTLRGDEDDVLSRYIQAADSSNADSIVRITADCPLIDPEIIDQTIVAHLQNGKPYTSNVLVRSYPVGMDVEVFPAEMLRRSSDQTREPEDHEHVTRHIRAHPELFSHLHVISRPSENWPELGLTLDEEQDYALLKKIVEHFPDSKFSCLDVIKLLRMNTDWVEISSAVKRRESNVTRRAYSVE